MTQIFETGDPELASEIFREQYTSMRMRIQGGRPLPLLRVAQTAVGRARLDQSTFRMTLDGGADPVDRILILRIRSGTVRYTSGGSEETYGPGDTCFPLPLGQAWSASFQDVDSELVVLDPALLDEVGAAGPEAGGPVRLLSHRPHSQAAAEQLWRMAETIGDSFAARPEAEAFPLVTASAARMLAAAVLTAFPNTAFPDTTLPEPAIGDRRDARPETLRRAIAHIEADPRADMTVADIAAACRVTPRAVQLAFRRHLDTTPMAYLRQVRLACAHQDLIAGDARTASVTEIAARWGFATPSQFAAAYRAGYGQSPSRALRR